MATRHYWIQLENRYWDMTPNDGGINRMTGERVDAAPKELVWLSLNAAGKLVERSKHTVEMHRPVEALILRRYAPPRRHDGVDAWTKPDDRKVNAWDLNEKNPTETMGTIPGPTIECNVGDKVVVHFRNMDFRERNGQFLNLLKRTHSLHPHGITFPPVYDGAYPLSPLDLRQRIDSSKLDETDKWEPLGLGNFKAQDGNLYKRGDWVPPGGTFSYFWDTNCWPSTAGVWLYHDHSVEDHHNVLHGAIGMLVIHDPDDASDVFVDIDNGGDDVCQHLPDRSVNGKIVVGGRYLRPPDKMLVLQLYHELSGGGMCINGRTFLGNAPTIVCGLETLIRFGFAAMNNNAFHTFHLHGHRWQLTGRSANGYIPVSQFVDTHIFGPADSFHFSIQQGSDTAPPMHAAKGEWHMHCHVLNHMVTGMMGSVLIVEEGDEALPLPVGVPLPAVKDSEPETQTSTSEVDIPSLQGSVVVGSGANEKELEVASGQLRALVISRPVIITVERMRFRPRIVDVAAGSTIFFDFRAYGHTVTSSDDGNGPIEINDGGGQTDSVSELGKHKVLVTGKPGTVIKYRCGNHPSQMTGEIRLL